MVAGIVVFRNTRHCPNLGLLLAQHYTRWANNNTALDAVRQHNALAQCWTDVGPLALHWATASCLLGYFLGVRWFSNMVLITLHADLVIAGSRPLPPGITSRQSHTVWPRLSWLCSAWWAWPGAVSDGSCRWTVTAASRPDNKGFHRQASALCLQRGFSRGVFTEIPVFKVNSPADWGSSHFMWLFCIKVVFFGVNMVILCAVYAVFSAYTVHVVAAIAVVYTFTLSVRNLSTPIKT